MGRLQGMRGNSERDAHYPEPCRSMLDLIGQLYAVMRGDSWRGADGCATRALARSSARFRRGRWPSGRCSGVYVRSSLGRTGVGRAIMSRLESDIVKRGHECATLDSSPNAVGFYIKLGYALVGLPDNAGALPMRKTLRVPDP